MASPFNVFRRNQRIMMAMLVGLSMFAFIFFDPSLVRSGGLPKSLTVVLVAGVCALGLWFVGQRRGQGNEWALWGAVLGALAAFLYVRSANPEPVIRGKGIEISDRDLQKLGQKRYQVNRFVYEAARRAKASRAVQGFGAADDRSMIQFVLGRREAKRLGISLTDDAVNRYIRDITDDKLSKQDFHEILRELTLSEGDLFDQLRSELEVRLALGIQAPPSDNWLNFDPQSRQFFYQPKLIATPDEQWRIFCKLNVKQSLSVVALPASAFLSKVEEPADSELQAFFEMHKGRPPGPQGEPGFLQPHRVRLAYLSADFEKFEARATAPSDDEITAYYEENKDLKYRIREIPGKPFPDEDVPADAASPVNVPPALPAPQPPVNEDAPADADAPSPGVEASCPSSEPSPKDGGEASAALRPHGFLFRLASLSAQAEDETQPADAAGNDDKKDEALANADVAKSPDDGASASEEPSTSDPFPVDLPSPGASSGKEPVRYRELDDDLREQIREEMLRDRAYEKMGEARDKAWQKMNELATRYQDAEESKREAAAAAIAEELKEYAVNYGLTYVETDLMSEMEMQTSAKEQIGAAVLTTDTPLQFQSTSVVDDLFPRGGQSGPMYAPQRADSRLRSQRYAYWKIQDVPQHVPEWKDEGIKDQALGAWKLDKARVMARQRAEALLELAKKNPHDLAAALTGQTVTGDPGSESVVIKETPRFSWLTTQSTTPFDFGLGDLMPPRLSFVDGVDQPGDDFMQTVFSDLKVGDVGIAANFPRTVIYLVQVRERDAAEPAPEGVEGYQTADELRSKFLADLGSDRTGMSARPYNQVLSNAYFQLQQEWVKAFDQRYGVELDDLESMRQATGRRPRR